LIGSGAGSTEKTPDTFSLLRETISLRLPKSLLDQLKTIANKRDVPYQTLLKLFVLERVQAELHHKPAKAS
jgi:predicted DNA binding CopG/RHH family protein